MIVDHSTLDLEPVYEYTPEIELALNVAFVTGESHFVRRPSGSEKSSLARSIAKRLSWSFTRQLFLPRLTCPTLEICSPERVIWINFRLHL
jgi:MoxR-like ATPase